MSEEATEVSEVVDSTSEEASNEVVDTPAEVGELASEELAEEVVESVEAPTFEIKVNGEVLQLTQDEMVELAQKGKSSVQRFQEAAKARKELEAERAAVQAAIQGSPEELFKMKIQAGLMNETDMKRWVLEQALAISEEPELTEEQLRMKEMEQELEALRKGKDAEEKSKKDAEFQAEVERYRDDFSSQIMTAIQTGGLDNDPLTIQRVASLLESSMDHNGNLQVSIQDAVDYVKQQDRSSYLDYVKGLDVDAMERLFGEEKMKALKAKDLAKIKNPEAAPVNPFKSEKAPAKAKASMKDFFANIK